MPPHRHAYRPVVMGTRGAVASAHPLASMAGIRMLLAGGNAADAAVAVGSTLNVVEPFMSGMGGIGLSMISNAKTGERHILDFIGRTPRGADVSKCKDDELNGGPKACATPGNLGGWLAIHERFGSLPRAAVFAPAIELAENGVPFTWKSVAFFEQSRAQLAYSKEAERIYLSGALRPGKVVTYKDLAATLRQAAEGGAEAFYRGPIAKAIAKGVQEAGGWLSVEDFAAFAPEWREPATIKYRAHDIYSAPPPFSTFQMLETLNIMEGFDVRGWGHNSVECLHHLIEAIKLASADRLAYAYAGDVPINGLLSKAYAKSQRARIDAKSAGASEGERHNPVKLKDQIAEGYPAKFENEQTTHFACADANGLVVTLTNTLGMAFGSGFVVPGTGVLLNNSHKWKDRDPSSPNVLKPGAKGVTMMSPTQIFRDGRFELSIGTPGSYGILQTTAQMILNALDFGFNVQEAIEQPRVRVYRDRLVDAEARIPAETRTALGARGHTVNTIDEWTWIGGQGIARDPESGALMAGADPRRDGYALAI